jgi:hypothetical protein
MASRARRDIKRNLLLILLALVALGGLIAFVGVVQGGSAPVLMPEERTRFLERRANAADNGFADLLEASKVLEGLGPAPLCDDLLKTGKLNLQRPASPQNPLETSAALARYLGENSFCPNDDPRFREYMDKTKQVLPAVQAALAKPFILHSSMSIAEVPEQPDPLAPVEHLLRHMCTCARYESIVVGDTANATSLLQNAFAVSRKLEESGSFILRVGNSSQPTGREGFFRFGLSQSARCLWTAIPVVAKYAVDRNEPLDALLEMTRSTVEEAPDRSALFLAYCMMLDDVMEGVQVPSGMDFGHRLIMAIMARNARRDARILADQETAIREAVNGPLDELSSELRSIAGERAFLGPRFMTLTMALLNVRSVIEGHKMAAGLAVRLEAFRKDHGDYPEKLEELVPQYLSKIPAMPMAHIGGGMMGGMAGFGRNASVPQSAPKAPEGSSSGPPPVYEKFKEGYVISEGGASSMPDTRRPYYRGDDFSLDMRAIPAPNVAAGAGLALPPG